MDFGMITKSIVFLLSFLAASAVYCDDKPKKFDFNIESEVVTGARADVKLRNMQIETLKADLARVRDEANELSKQNKELQEELNSVPLLKLTNLSRLQEYKPQIPDVYFQITTSPSCEPCHRLLQSLAAYHKSANGWSQGTDVGNIFQVNELTDMEWTRRGILLPRVELIERGRTTEIASRSPVELCNIYNDAVRRDRAQYKASSNSEQPVGMVMTTITGKKAATELIDSLIPFLDGGTLKVEYTAKPGVVKDKLTIKRGSTGVTIPSKIGLTLKVDKGILTVTMIDPKPQILVSALSRDIQAIEVIPSRISVRLNYMIDPEIGLK